MLQKQTAAPLLYNTTHLLADLSKCTDLTIDMLTKLVQSLYENRLITYPRTSSEHLTGAMKDETVKIIKLLFEMPEFAKYAIPVDNFAPCTRRHYDDSKVRYQLSVLFIRKLLQKMSKLFFRLIISCLQQPERI